MQVDDLGAVAKRFTSPASLDAVPSSFVCPVGALPRACLLPGHGEREREEREGSREGERESSFPPPSLPAQSYRGTSLIRTPPLLGPYSRTISRVICWS